MSYNIALSGLNAAQSDLGVISHNVANASTVGFKESRAEFGDIFATSALGSGSTAIGSGVLLSSVSQQFHQGNLVFTQNTLDLAISGNGFFAMAPNLTSQDFQYTRSGQFGVDASGYVVNSAGQYLQAFPVNTDGTASSTSTTSALRLPSSAGNPSPTTEVEMGMNLLASETPLSPASFDPTQSTTYHSSTSVTVYDSLGNGHVATTYFVKDNAAANQWAAYFYVDGNPVDVTGGVAGAGGQQYAQLNFNADGSYASATPASPVPLANWDPGNGANPLQLNYDFANNTPTQFDSPFNITALSQDGFTTGRLSGLEIGDSGLVRANYTNGQSVPLGKVALVDFSNPQGLKQLGNTSWADSIDAGDPIPGEAGTGKFGAIKSGALESSNVDLTEELVSLITAQRNFQANAKSIETANTLTQTIINLR